MFVLSNLMPLFPTIVMYLALGAPVIMTVIFTVDYFVLRRKARKIGYSIYPVRNTMFLKLLQWCARIVPTIYMILEISLMLHSRKLSALYNVRPTSSMTKAIISYSVYAIILCLLFVTMRLVRIQKMRREEYDRQRIIAEHVSEKENKPPAQKKEEIIKENVD